jgi:O-antigen/teichoic acid export membrane protein
MAGSLVYTVFVARRLGATEFGVYTTILTFLFFGGLFADFGILKVIIRNVSRYPEEAGDLFWNSIVTMTLISLVAWVLIGIIALHAHYPDRMKVLLLGSCVILVLNSVMRPSDGILRAYQRMEIPAVIEIALSIVSYGVGVALVILGFGVSALIVLNVSIALLDTVLRFTIVRWGFVRTPFRFDLRSLWGILRQSAPIALLGSLAMLSKRIDNILLSVMSGVTAVGLYNAAVKITSFLWIPMQSLAQALLPYMSARLRISVDALQTTYEKTVRLCIIVAFPVVTLIFCFSKQIIGVLFGKEYLAGGTPIALMILIWAFFWDMISGPVNVVVINSERSLRQFIPYAVGVTALSVAMNLVLIPRYGLLGASVAALVSAIVVNTIKILVVHRVFQEKPRLHLMAVRPALGAVAMWITIYVLRGAAVPLAAAAAMVIYVLALWVSREFTPDDRRLVALGLKKARAKVGLAR